MSDEQLLEKAIEALENGRRQEAYDIVARLLQTDSENPTYWVWLAAASASRKEKLYCLSVAYRKDPSNEAARRGLILLGQLDGEDTPPFPLERVIHWQENLRLETEAAEKPEGLRGLFANPALRAVGIGSGLLVLVFGVFMLISRPQVGQLQITAAPTNTPAPVQATATPSPTQGAALGPVPLAERFEVAYTPTPLYVQPEHDVQTREIARAALDEYRRGNLSLSLSYFQQLVEYDPQAVDGYYYQGEIYRQMDDPEAALNAYDQALEIDPAFGPAYLGRALALQAINPKANIFGDLSKAAEYAPDFIDAWLALARYHLANEQLDSAQEAVQQALGLNPDNAEAHLLLAKIALAQEDLETARQEARKANELDLTLLDAYLLLGKIAFREGDLEAAYEPIKLYTTYRDDDAEAWMILAFAENARQNYEQALLAADQALELDVRLGQAYQARAEAHLNLGEGAKAEYDYKTAQKFFPRSFAISLGIAHAQAAQGNPGNAYQQLEQARRLATTDEELVQYHYWRAYYLEEIGRHDLALESWQALLDYPPELMPEDWRTLAEEKVQE